MSTKSCLYVVAVPIGNPRDITLRAIDILRQVNGVICEEQREGSTLLKRLDVQNELICLNEHNEDMVSADIVYRLQSGQSLALVSDCGTPVFADPGQRLIELLVGSGVAVVPVPGPSSLMAALSICDFEFKRFVYGGFMPPKEDQRRAELTRLRGLNMPVVLMDTPYRLTSVLQDVSKVFGGNHQVMLACDLTLPGERIERGTVDDILKRISGKKAEFVLIIR